MSFWLVTEPIDRWPLPDTPSRRNHTFRASYQDTIEILERELLFLDAAGAVVIQVVTRDGASDIRRDGLLRARAQINHPGVRISFRSRRHGDLTYSTDEFTSAYSGQMPAWQANLRAIALGLEALRAVDRYGISKSGEQYRGWQAISGRPAGGGEAELSVEVAERILREQAGTYPSGSTREVLYRLAKSASHPDRNQGDRTRWDAVERAARSLGLLS